MTTKLQHTVLWSVRIKETLMSGHATRTEGVYLVRVSRADAARFLNHRAGKEVWTEEKISAPNQAMVAREIVDCHFHLAYSSKASVTVTSVATECHDDEPSREPDNYVVGIAMWEIETR
jgi:hypothetical protein